MAADLSQVPLAELETESTRLSTAIRELQDQRRPVDDEISRRHDVIKALKTQSPAEIDAAIRAASNPS
jgi:FXSXX-COOH protein